MPNSAAICPPSEPAVSWRIQIDSYEIKVYVKPIGWVVSLRNLIDVSHLTALQTDRLGLGNQPDCALRLFLPLRRNNRGNAVFHFLNDLMQLYLGRNFKNTRTDTTFVSMVPQGTGGVVDPPLKIVVADDNAAICTSAVKLELHD